MVNAGSWKLWVIIALALTTLACASRRERREQAREDRRERAEERRAQRAQQPAPAATLPPISAAPAAVAPVPDAKIVFVRPSYYVGDLPVPTSVFDVTEPGEAKFIGILNRRTRVEYPVTSGLRTFMIVSETADFMQAQIVGGKTYYALVTPRPAAWKARFSLVPVRQNEQDVQKWDEDLQLVTNTSRTLSWAKSNAASADNKRDRYWPEWSSKPEHQRLAQTLNAEDGR